MSYLKHLEGNGMSYMKRFATKLSEEMGFGGEITEEVIAEGERRLRDKSRNAVSEYQQHMTKAMIAQEEYYQWQNANIQNLQSEQNHDDRHPPMTDG